MFLTSLSALSPNFFYSRKEFKQRSWLESYDLGQISCSRGIGYRHLLCCPTAPGNGNALPSWAGAQTHFTFHALLRFNRGLGGEIGFKQAQDWAWSLPIISWTGGTLEVVTFTDAMLSPRTSISSSRTVPYPSCRAIMRVGTCSIGTFTISAITRSTATPSAPAITSPIGGGIANPGPVLPCR